VTSRARVQHLARRKGEEGGRCFFLEAVTVAISYIQTSSSTSFSYRLAIFSF
jgi:hypothetical protein